MIVATLIDAVSV